MLCVVILQPLVPAFFVSGLTGYDLQRSVDCARKAEGDRWTSVMIHSAVKGKEREAAKILAGKQRNEDTLGEVHAPVRPPHIKPRRLWRP